MVLPAAMRLEKHRNERKMRGENPQPIRLREKGKQKNRKRGKPVRRRKKVKFWTSAKTQFSVNIKANTLFLHTL